jgi:hypothetical protein
VSPSKSVVEEVISIIHQQKSLEWTNFSVHVASAVVKEFLREVNDPLLPSGQFNQWTALEGLKILIFIHKFRFLEFFYFKLTKLFFRGFSGRVYKSGSSITQRFTRSKPISSFQTPQTL